MSYLLTYKKQIIAVLLIMLVSTVLTLITPLFYEYAIDDCIGTGDLPKLYRVMILTLIMSITVILAGCGCTLWQRSVTKRCSPYVSSSILIFRHWI